MSAQQQVKSSDSQDNVILMDTSEANSSPPNINVSNGSPSAMEVAATPKLGAQGTPGTEVTKTPKMDITEASDADFVTPKTAGRQIKVLGRKKVIRISKPKLLKKKPRYPLRDLEAKKLEKSRVGEHPAYKEMVEQAIFNGNPRKGISRAAIKNYIVEKYPVGDRNKMINNHIRKAIGDLVEDDTLVSIGDKPSAARFQLASEVKQRMKKEAKKSAVHDASHTPQRKAKTASTPKTGSAAKRQAVQANETPSKKAKKSSETTPKTRSSAKRQAAQVTPSKKSGATKAGSKAKPVDKKSSKPKKKVVTKKRVVKRAAASKKSGGSKTKKA